MTPEVWGTILTGGAGVLGVLFGWLGKRRTEKKTSESAAIAERSEIVALINTQLVEPLSKELSKVRSRLDDAEREINNLKKAKSTLIKFVHHLLEILRVHGLMAEVKMSIPEEVDE